MLDPARLFKNWPQLPPWWLVSCPDAAAILNVRPATLRRPEGPPIYPSLYLKPTRGNPFWYQYGALRSWAVAELGLTYPFEEQCSDFFAATLPALREREDAIPCFAALLEADRAALVAGKEPRWLDAGIVHELDRWRQPVFVNDSITQKPDYWAA